AIRFVAKKHVSAPDLFAQVAQARGALNPALVSHGVRARRPRAEVPVEFPAALGIDLEDPVFGHAGYAAGAAGADNPQRFQTSTIRAIRTAGIALISFSTSSG